MRDAREDTTSRYVYDMAGRAVEYRKSSDWDTDSGAEQVYIHNYYEDGTNRLLEQNVRAAGIGVDTFYSYGKASQGQMPDVIYGLELKNKVWQSKINYEYDSLGRRTKQTLVYGSKQTPVTYSYVPGSTLLERIDNNGDEYRYVYDNMGQITAIYHNNVLERSYAYGVQGEVNRENDRVANISCKYTYDKGGNILSKAVYPYTSGTLGTPTETIVYGYDDAIWKDLLTSYKGQSITYDTIGNPLTYRNGMVLPCGARLCLWRTSRLANRRPQRQPLLADSATGSARKRCLAEWPSDEDLQQDGDQCDL